MRLFAILLGLGVLLLIIILWWLYQSTVRTYAVLEDVKIDRDPASQGRVHISFTVVKPGKVYFGRQSGKIETEVIDYFNVDGDRQRRWSWIYEPGSNIHIDVLYRGALWRKSTSATFPTAKQADIVILMDTTGSMSRSIATLKEKCVEFSEALKQKQLDHRFALIGFGDMRENEWLDKHSFTERVATFQQHVSNVERFDGGDLPESSLEAIEEALKLPFDSDSTRRIYLVTDAQFREPSQSGASVEQIVKKIAEKKALLNVFTREEFFPDYQRLVGTSGKVEALEDFGQVLSEGRILED